MAVGVAELQAPAQEEQLLPPAPAGADDLGGRQIERSPGAGRCGAPRRRRPRCAGGTAARARSTCSPGRADPRSRRANASTVQPPSRASDQFAVSGLGRYSPAGTTALALPCATPTIVGPTPRRPQGPLRIIANRRVRSGQERWRSCRRSSASTTTSSSPRTCSRRWLPAKFRAAGPHVERRGIGVMKHIGGGVVRAVVRRRRAEGRLLGLRGPRLHQQAARGRGRLRPRRHDDVADHLRRDAAGLLRPEGPHRRHGDELGRGVAVLPHVPALLRPDVPRGEGPRARARRACTPTTTGWSRSGAATAAVASSR